MFAHTLFLSVQTLPLDALPRAPRLVRLPLAGLLAAAMIALAGCTPRYEREVIVYAALDAEFSRPILEQFERHTGIVALPKFDVESTKTVGLTQAIIAEANEPRCDVFWNNEILNTLRLQQRGVLEAYRPKNADDYPKMFRSADETWHGFAARARVLLVNTEAMSEDERPDSIKDLADAKWRGRCGLAKPLFGTTATHVACLFAELGPQEASRLFRDMKANDVQVFPGNKQVAQAVSAGSIAFGLTDTDDAIIEVEAGQLVAIVYPDQGPDGLGTLFIPNTLAIIKGSANTAAARRLVDYLLTPEIEIQLSRGASAQIPLNLKVDVPLRVETPRTVKSMDVDFAAAARQWDAAARFVRDTFARVD